MKKTKKKSNTGKLVLVGILGFLVLVSSAFLYAYNFYRKNLKQVAYQKTEVSFTIEEGEDLNQIIDELYEAGLIRNSQVAKIFVKLNKIDEYYYGNYILDASWDTKEIFAHICDYSNAVADEITCTIVEGMWAKNAAYALQQSTGIDADMFLVQWNNPSYIEYLINKYDCLTDEIYNSQHCYLEGFIFPETYSFYANSSVKQITERILDHTEYIYEKYKTEIENSGYSTFEIFTLASVINFEAGTEEDMKLVSSVFHNRLDIWMPLQSSVTVCYALYDKFNDWQDCETNPNVSSKYNTYLNYGLPVGPICNPGERAINAALNPENTDYYYFMANINTGKMYYAKTLDEHNYNCDHYYY